MKFALMTLVGIAMTMGSVARAAIQPVDFANRVVGHYVLTSAKGDCAASLLARGVRNTRDARVMIESPQKVPLTMIRWINRGNMYENVDYWSASANRVNTTLMGNKLTMIEQSCAKFQCDTNLQISVRDTAARVKIVVQTKSVRCEYTK